MECPYASPRRSAILYLGVAVHARPAASEFTCRSLRSRVRSRDAMGVSAEADPFDDTMIAAIAGVAGALKAEADESAKRETRLEVMFEHRRPLRLGHVAHDREHQLAYQDRGA